MSKGPSALLCLSALLTPLHAVAQEEVVEQQCAPAAVQTITDAGTRLVLQALVDPSRVHDRTSLLTQYLATPVESPNSARQVATSHARVVLAAELIKQARYADARQILSRIDLSSTVAVDAALLLAESWRLEGNDANSQAWLIRVVQRYSSDPRALEGLLLSAQDLADAGKVREAWALYGLISDKVLANVEQVNAMQSSPDALVDQLLATRLDESRSVNSQVVKLILQSDQHSALSNMREILESRKQLDCLVRQDDSIKDEAWDESILAANVTSFQTMLETEARINEKQLAALKTELAAATARERPLIEEEILALEEHMRSAANRLNELRQQQSSLPATSLSRKKQLEQKIRSTEVRVSENREAIRGELQQALASLQGHYRELAAETQLARAELMQLMAVNR